MYKQAGNKEWGIGHGGWGIGHRAWGVGEDILEGVFVKRAKSEMMISGT